MKDSDEWNLSNVAEGALEEEGEVLVHRDVDHLRFLVVDCFPVSLYHRSYTTLICEASHTSTMYLHPNSRTQRLVPKVYLLYNPTRVYFTHEWDIAFLEMLNSTYYVAEGGVWREVFKDAGLLLGV